MQRTDPYTSYQEFCKRIGVKPMEEDRWRRENDNIRPVTKPESPVQARAQRQAW